MIIAGDGLAKDLSGAGVERPVFDFEPRFKINKQIERRFGAGYGLKVAEKRALGKEGGNLGRDVLVGGGRGRQGQVGDRDFGFGGQNGFKRGRVDGKEQGGDKSNGKKNGGRKIPVH